MNALMPDAELHGYRRSAPGQREGFAEIDRAIAENRLTAYRWKKSWADPWSRAIIIAVMTLFGLFGTFVVYTDILSK